MNVPRMLFKLSEAFNAKIFKALIQQKINSQFSNKKALFPGVGSIAQWLVSVRVSGPSCPRLNSWHHRKIFKED